MKENYVILFKSETSPEWQEFFGTEQEAIAEATLDNRHLNYGRSGFIIKNTAAKTHLWIVNQWRDGNVEFQGAFSSEQKAIEACKNENYCVCPCVLDEEVSEETSEWVGAYYPYPQK